MRSSSCRRWSGILHGPTQRSEDDPEKRRDVGEHGGRLVVAAWSYSIVNAWPKKLTIGTLKAADTSVLTETLVVEYESLEVE